MRMDRREFLGKAMAGAGGMLLARQAGGAARPAATNYDPFEMVPLGKTGIRVTRVGIGTGSHGGKRSSNQVRLGRAKCIALIRTAYEKGIRLFDMADTYGSHFALEGLKGIPREKYAIVSKVWPWPGRTLPEPDRPDADIVVTRFLKELGTDYIDLLLLHCMQKPDWPKQLARQMDIIARLKAKGIVRAHGVSVHSLAAMKAAAKCPWVQSVHARINAYGTAMDDTPEKVAPVLQELHDAGKAIIGMKLIGNGKFHDSVEKRDRSLRYVLGLGSVDAMVVGFEKGAEIDEFVARMRKVPRSLAK